MEGLIMLSKKICVMAIGTIMAGSLGSMAVCADTLQTGDKQSNFVTQDASPLRLDEPSNHTFPPDSSEIDTLTTNSMEVFSVEEQALDYKTEAIMKLMLLSDVQPRRLAGVAEEMGISDDAVNALYVTAVVTRNLYEETSKNEISKWCRDFSAQRFPDKVSAEDIAPFQESLSALDGVVLDSVSAEVEKMTSRHPEAFSVMMQETQTFNLGSSAIDTSNIDPADWVENHSQACAELGIN
jgi:hypothetical protein